MANPDMIDITVEKIIASIFAVAALWKAIPSVKALFEKNKKILTELEKHKIQESIMQLQKQSAIDSCDIIKTKLIDSYDKISSDELTRIHYINAIECALLEMRKEMYIEFEKNHFVQRENWKDFISNQADKYYQMGFNEILLRFPEIKTIQGLYAEIKTDCESLIKKEIQNTFDNAKEVYINKTKELEVIK